MDGILLFDKPLHWTSHDAVGFVRSIYGVKKVGHAGTLDPLATGLLVLLLGQTTKQSELFLLKDKEYQGVMTLGIRTTTQDMEGAIVEQKDFLPPSSAELKVVFSSFVGEIQQKVPDYSAVKVGGQKLCDAARRGQKIQNPIRSTKIYNLDLLWAHSPDFAFTVSCSKGTYIRTLCEDIGQKLGTVAVLSCLRRTRIGDFLIEKAVTPDKIYLSRANPEMLNKFVMQGI